MDKKKKITITKWLTICAFVVLAYPLQAQNVNEIKFCGHDKQGDSINLFLNVLDDNEKKWHPSLSDLESNLIITEDEVKIPSNRRNILPVTTGKSIPKECTFSVLVDLSIPSEGKESIYKAIKKNLVEKAPDSCVYLSFFGDEVTPSKVVTLNNLSYEDFLDKPTSKCFYSAVYSKLAEFNFYDYNADLLNHVNMKNGANVKNDIICKRALQKDAKNFLFIFTEGSQPADAETHISYMQVTEYQRKHDTSCIRPKVYAFYYTANNDLNTDVERTLKGITQHQDIPLEYRGYYRDSNNMDEVVKGFEEAVNEAAYDYIFAYKPTRSYSGDVEYKVFWQTEEKGKVIYPIASIETIESYEEESNVWTKYLWALLIAVLTILFFFFVMKILIPGIKSRAFAAKYYKKYIPEANVQRRACHYCRQEILPGDKVVTRCKHIMHVQCWKQNGFKCAEYGQNCKEGIQEHIDWKNLFGSGSLRDIYLTIWGICAGLVSWIVYVLLGQKSFTGFARGIANTFLSEAQKEMNLDVCISKISAFLIIGLLLGFFLSLVLRYNDGVRKNDWRSLLKTFGLSLLSGVIGMAAFALGGIILCWIASIPGVSVNAWYASLPAYLLFSICLSLSLVIKSSIPLKSALLGGIGSALIGFLVLYFTNKTNSKWSWMNMLLNFVIYGGGLGASLVTVRMLAEKYFLVIKNGVKAGQRIPIHKWMNATGGGNKVTIGMTERCEIQMTWEKSNKVAKEHVYLYVDHQRSQAMLSPLATGVVFNSRAQLPIGKPVPLTNNDTFSVGDTIFQYVEN